MKSIILSSKKEKSKSHLTANIKNEFENSKENNINNKENDIKIREKIKNLKCDNSNNILINLRDHNNHIKYINNIFIGIDFPEKPLIINELKTKIHSYKQQDKKKYQEYCNLITLDNVIEKLVICKLKCFYCNKNMTIFFEKVRDQDQWTLDRINNFDEHSNENTIICCLKCNLQRRRKNSEKFLFTKQLETEQIKIKKI